MIEPVIGFARRDKDKTAAFNMRRFAGVDAGRFDAIGIETGHGAIDDDGDAKLGQTVVGA